MFFVFLPFKMSSIASNAKKQSRLMVNITCLGFPKCVQDEEIKPEAVTLRVSPAFPIMQQKLLLFFSLLILVG